MERVDNASVIADLFKKIGPYGAVLLAILFVYFNPPDSSEFQRNTLDRLAVVEARADKLQGEVLELRDENRALRSQLVNFKSVQDSYPFPAWFKDLSGKVISANLSYETLYLTPRGYSLFDYVGNDDYAVWPKDIADRFRANDQKVFREDQMIVFEEELEISSGVRERYWFIKYPRYINGNIVGIAGMLLPIQLDNHGGIEGLD